MSLRELVERRRSRVDEILERVVRRPRAEELAPRASAEHGEVRVEVVTPKEARARILAAMTKLKAMVVGHHEMIEAVFTALVAGEHVLVVGPPGTAKSYTVELLSRLVQAKFFRYQLTPRTQFDELFGPIDVVELSRGRFVRRWSPIIEAEIVYLDEVSRANPVILNSLLSMMQERIVYDPMAPEQARRVNLWTLVGTTNWVPEDEELRAFFDRFAAKVRVGYLNSDAEVAAAFRARWRAGGGAPQPVASMSDVRLLHAEAEKLLRSRSFEHVYTGRVVPLLLELRRSGKLTVSDRTLIEKLPKMIASHAVIAHGPGAGEAQVLLSAARVAPWVAASEDEATVLRDSWLGRLAAVQEQLDTITGMVATGRVDEAVKLLDAAREALQRLNAPETVVKLVEEAFQRVEKNVLGGARR